MGVPIAQFGEVAAHEEALPVVDVSVELEGDEGVGDLAAAAPRSLDFDWGLHYKLLIYCDANVGLS
jgi:hypothetical protein